MPILGNFRGGVTSYEPPKLGLKLAAVTGTSVQPASNSISVKWTDPADLTYEGDVVATWAKTRVVYKAGSAPTSATDGSYIDVTTRNQYASNWLTVSTSLIANTLYYIAFYPCSTEGVYGEAVVLSATTQSVDLTPASITSLTSTYNSMTVKWDDPDDIVQNGITVSRWVKTVVRYSTSSYPTSSTSGSDGGYTTTRDQYKSSGKTISGLAQNTTYYVTVFAIRDDGAEFYSSASQKSVKTSSLTKVAKPSLSGTTTWTYDGTTRTPTVKNYNSTYMTQSGTTSTANAGTHTIKYTLKSGYVWSDESTGVVTLTWTINRATISTKPSASVTTFTYDGNPHYPSWSNYSSSQLNIGGTTSSRTAPGTYTTTFTPNSNYQWSDGTRTAYSINWVINKITLTVPSQSGTLTYNGNSQSPTWSNYNSSYMSVSVTPQTNAGTYTATFRLTSSYAQWSGGSTSNQTVNWTINPYYITTTPSQSGTLTYTGNTLTPTWSNYNSTYLTIGGDTSGINAGTYTATFTPKANCAWSGGSTAAKSVSWTIGKAKNSITTSETYVVLDDDNPTYTMDVVFAYPADIAIEGTANDCQFAITKVSGSRYQVIFEAIDRSGADSLEIYAETNSNASFARLAITIQCSFLPEAGLEFNEYSWADISMIVGAGKGRSYWNIGDMKIAQFEGVIGTYEAAPGMLDAVIMGFDHDGNTNTMDLMIWTALIDERYGQLSLGGTKYFNMTHWGGCSSWASCDLRYDILGSTDTPPDKYGRELESSTIGYDASTTCAISPVKNTYMSTLESSLRAVMKPMKIYTDNGIPGGGESATNITATIDYLPLPSVYEIIGLTDFSNPNEANFQNQYEFFEMGNWLGCFDQYGQGTLAWTRSISPYYTDEFCYLFENGNELGSSCGSMYWCKAVRPIFRV